MMLPLFLYVQKNVWLISDVPYFMLNIEHTLENICMVAKKTSVIKKTFKINIKTHERQPDKGTLKKYLFTYENSLPLHIHKTI